MGRLNNFVFVGIAVSDSRCVANMFHSVITDALNDPQLESLIRKVREVIKKLRTFHYASQLRALNCRKSLILDCRNRFVLELEKFIY